MMSGGRTAGTAGRPRGAVLLLDSLNRHMRDVYEFDTPNLDRFAERSLPVDRHHTGWLPCMPARYGILCGAWHFLWRPWGSVEAPADQFEQLGF